MDKEYTIRPYQSPDQPHLLDLLRRNTPQYFDPAEEQDFIKYLDIHVEHYFVVEKDDRIIACGGINYFEDEGIARISWDMVHPEFHGKGIGTELTQFRINEIKKNPAIRMIIVRTTQLVFPFYEKLGFVLERTEKDFWAAGIDLYQMSMAIN